MFFGNKNEKSDENLICPFLNKPCIKNKCNLYVKIQGMNPQTGKDVDIWDCVIKITPLILIDHTKHLENLRACNEQTRNEVIKLNSNLVNTMVLLNRGYVYLPNQIPVINNEENEKSE